MIINFIEFKKGDKLDRLPSSGNFNSKLNIIYSKDNKSSKTSLIRNILSFFISSIKLPNEDPKYRINNVIINITNNAGKTFNLMKSKYGGFVVDGVDMENIYLSDEKELFMFFYPKTSKSFLKNIRISWIISNFYLDQDSGYMSRQRIPSLMNMDREVDSFIKKWLILGQTNSVLERKIDTSLIKKEIKEHERLIDILKRVSDEDITGNGSYDINYGNKIAKQIEIKRKEYKAISSEIYNLNLVLEHNGKLTKKRNRNLLDYKTIFVNGKEIDTDRSVNVKINLDSIMAFSKIAFNDINKKNNKDIQIINQRKDKLNDDLKNISNDILSLKDKLRIQKIPSNEKSFSAIISQKNELEKRLMKISDENKSINTKSVEEYRNIQIQMANSKIELFKKISSENISSKSGSSIRVDQFIEFMSFIYQTRTLNFPNIMDSLKENDVDRKTQDIFIDHLETMSNVQNRQTFITLSNPDGEFSKKNHNIMFEIKKYKI